MFMFLCFSVDCAAAALLKTLLAAAAAEMARPMEPLSLLSLPEEDDDDEEEEEDEVDEAEVKGRDRPCKTSMIPRTDGGSRAPDFFVEILGPTAVRSGSKGPREGADGTFAGLDGDDSNSFLRLLVCLSSSDELDELDDGVPTLTAVAVMITRVVLVLGPKEVCVCCITYPLLAAVAWDLMVSQWL